MKISKRRLRQIIKEERAKIVAESKGQLSEARSGAVSLGFANFQPNRNPDFAKSYGAGAKVVGRYESNNSDLMEQPLPATGAPEDNAFQTLKMGGAWKDLQEMMHEFGSRISEWQDKHETTLVDAKMEDVGVQIEEANLSIEAIRQLAHQFR